MSLRKSPSPSTQHPPNPKRTKGKLQCPICRSRLYGARRHYRERPNLRFQCTGCLTWLVYGEGVPSSKSQTFWVLEGADIVIHEPQCKEPHTAKEGDAVYVLKNRKIWGKGWLYRDPEALSKTSLASQKFRYHITFTGRQLGKSGKDGLTLPDANTVNKNAVYRLEMEDLLKNPALDLRAHQRQAGYCTVRTTHTAQEKYVSHQLAQPHQ